MPKINSDNCQAIILAAGKGTRMKSDLPKVLHKVAGKALVSYVIDACHEAGITKPMLVVGHGSAEVRAAIGDDVSYCEQFRQLGTGHAVMCALPFIKEKKGEVLVMCGDAPLIEGKTLIALRNYFRESGAVCTVLSAEMKDPTGYGRIFREGTGRVLGIIEEKDATASQKKITEINTGTYCFDLAALRSVIDDLDTNNAQGEYYLTQVLELLIAKGYQVNAYLCEDSNTALGVNDRIQQAAAEKILRKRVLKDIMLEGATIIDPKTTYIEKGVKIGADTVIRPNTHLRGNTVIGANCVIGPDCDILNSTIGDNSQVRYAVLDSIKTETGANIGPYTYMRPGTELAENVKIGGFCEVKNTKVGAGSKIPHLSYIGDAEVGSAVNIGCGCITCNYDGYKKYKTEIGNNAFVGCNVNMVAPVKIADDSYVAAGSTVTEDVPTEALAIARERQRNIEGWVRKNKEKRKK